MIELIKTKKFEEERIRFIKNNTIRAEKVIKTLVKLTNNPKHPSLHLEKLQGSSTWTVRIDKGNRIFLIWNNETTILLLDIGKHDKYSEY